MIDIGFLLGFAFGCICTAPIVWLLVARPLASWGVPQPPRPPMPWERAPLTRELGAAARGEVADLVVSTGRFVSSVRSLKHQINRAHASLKGDL